MLKLLKLDFKPQQLASIQLIQQFEQKVTKYLDTLNEEQQLYVQIQMHQHRKCIKMPILKSYFEEMTQIKKQLMDEIQTKITGIEKQLRFMKSIDKKF